MLPCVEYFYIPVCYTISVPVMCRVFSQMLRIELELCMTRCPVTRMYLCIVCRGASLLTWVLNRCDMTRSDPVSWCQALQTDLAKQRSHQSYILVRNVRCDGHAFHASASIPLTRSASSSATYSAAIMIRTSDYILKLRAGAFHMLDAELEFDDSLAILPSEEARCAQRVVESMAVWL